MLYMRNKILCHRNEKKMNQNFVWLKVAVVNISHSTVHDCVPLQWCHFYLLLNEMKVSLNRNGLLLKKISFKNMIHFNKNNIDIFINDIWQKYAGDYSKLQGDLNFFTNEKAMLTFTRRFLPPNHPVA